MSIITYKSKDVVPTLVRNEEVEALEEQARELKIKDADLNAALLGQIEFEDAEAMAEKLGKSVNEVAEMVMRCELSASDFLDLHEPSASQITASGCKHLSDHYDELKAFAREKGLSLEDAAPKFLERARVKKDRYPYQQQRNMTIDELLNLIEDESLRKRVKSALDKVIDESKTRVKLDENSLKLEDDNPQFLARWPSETWQQALERHGYDSWEDYYSKTGRHPSGTEGIDLEDLGY